MKYRRKNKLIFDKRISFNKINFKKINFKKFYLINKKKIFILTGILSVVLLLFLFPKFISKNTVIIQSPEKPKLEKIQVVEPLFLEKLDVKVYKVDLEKEYGISLKKNQKETLEVAPKFIANRDKKILELEIIPKNKGISQWKDESLVFDNIFFDEALIESED